MRWILLLLPLWMAAQQRSPLDADFRFRDGVYFTPEALMANQPDVEWGDIAGEMVQLPEDYRVQIDSFGYKGGRYVPPYAISLDGLPYLFVRQERRRPFHEFAGLRNVGRYATVRFDTLEHTRQLMEAFNPVTGQPFRRAWVERDRRREVHRVVDMTDGRRFPLEAAVVARLVSTEEDLSSAVRKLAPDEEQKMIRALILYNERYPLLIPVPEATD